MDALERLDLSRLSALVVDDNVHMRRLMSDILHAFGIGTVHESADGSDAFTIMRNNFIDLVLCDWVMHNLSGIELLRTVRKPGSEVRNPTVAFIMITAHAEEWRLQEAYDAGATTCLVKPFSTAALYERFISALTASTPSQSRHRAGGNNFGSER